jgi:hypothetical protein
MQVQPQETPVLRLVADGETLPVRHPYWCEQDDCATVACVRRTHAGIAEQFLTDYENGVITFQPGRVDERDGEIIGTSFVRLTVRNLDLVLEPMVIELDAIDLETLIRVAQRQLQHCRTGDVLVRDDRIVGQTGATDVA